jgi:DNA-binding CsgD family transcriptional regulator
MARAPQRRRPSEPSIHDRLEVYHLTPRERSVVYLLLRGCSNKEIASCCNIAVQTVKDHLSHIYGKTGVHQRTALFALLLGTAQDLKLRKIGAFYQGNAAVIDAYRVPTLDCVSGEHTQRRYTRAKVRDMAFFIKGEA